MRSLFFRRVCLAALLSHSALARAEIAPNDFSWLEDSQSAKTKAWVEEHNRVFQEKVEADPLYKELRGEISDILHSPKRIQFVQFLKTVVLDHQREKEHPLGVLRTSDMDAYIAGKPRWEDVLDIDALAKAEGERWNYRGLSCRRPDYQHCMLRLGANGSDLVESREFDLKTKSFVKDGFRTKSSRSAPQLLDQDTLILADGVAEENRTNANYPRVIRILQRKKGKISDKIIFEGKKTDTRVGVFVMRDEGRPFVLVSRNRDTFHVDRFHYENDRVRQIDLPDDITITGLSKGEMVLQSKSDWEGFPSGSVLSMPIADLFKKDRRLRLLFRARPNLTAATVLVGENFTYITYLEDLSTHIFRLLGINVFLSC